MTNVLDYNRVYLKEVCTSKSLSPKVIRIKNNLTFTNMKKRTIPSEFEGHFFLTTNQVCGLYNFSPKTLKRREKDQTIPIPPRVQISKNRYGYRTDLTFDCLEKISNGVF